MIGFMGRMALRAGAQRVTVVGERPGSDTLMRLTVDLGDHTRTILPGIKQDGPIHKRLWGGKPLSS